VQEHPSETADHLLSDRYIKEKLRPIMECPHCQKELPSKSCSGCGRDVPEESLYCLYCGNSFGETDTSYDGEGDELDFENRVLCPDGTCTGIIENGKCTECGKHLDSGGSEAAAGDE
jgi:hypothetical protein